MATMTAYERDERLAQQLDRAAEKLARRLVRAGVRFLDERMPDWYVPGVIEVELLDLSSPESCMLGQLAGNNMEQFFGAVKDRVGRFGYTDALVVFERAGWTAGIHTEQWAMRHGFERGYHYVDGFADRISVEYERLQRAWEFEILARRQHAEVVHATQDDH